MAKILQEDVLTVGGKQPQFVGVQVGEFSLCPDSDSGTRPSALRVKGPRTNLLVIGGDFPLRAELHSEGISYRGFQGWINADQKALLTALASNLTGRIWPHAGEVLLERIEALGEEKLLKAFHGLYKGVEQTMKRRKIFQSIPLFGERLADSLCPINN